MKVQCALAGMGILFGLGLSTSAVNGQDEIQATRSAGNGLLSNEFIYERAPFPSCHASTIEELPSGGLIAAWFGGSDEGNKDVTVWTSHFTAGKWSPPVEVAVGTNAGMRYPCWNPVLFQPKAGPLLLFYKVGPSPSEWWGMRISSADAGKTWSAPTRLPDGILGPIKNKPIELSDGTLLCPSSTEDKGWRIHVERSPDQGVTWTRTEALSAAEDFGAIQPSVLAWPGAPMQMLCRSRKKKIATIRSSDGGRTWEAMTLTTLPNPNAGLDAVLLSDHRALLVYNHTSSGRSPLNVALSSDGEKWQAGLVLENELGEYSYPAVIQARDGRVHVTYTWKRQRIKHAVIDPAKLTLQPMVAGQWPK